MVFWISYKWRLVIHICTPLGLLGVRRPRKTDENRTKRKTTTTQMPKKVYTLSNPCCDVRSAMGSRPRTSSCSWPNATENWSLAVPVPTGCAYMRPCPQTIVQFHISSRWWFRQSMGVRDRPQTREQHCDPWFLCVAGSWAYVSLFENWVYPKDERCENIRKVYTRFENVKILFFSKTEKKKT